MRFNETLLKGAFAIEPEPVTDERGSFSRTFCRDEFRAHGLEYDVVQCNTSYNKHKGTLRGMHYQVEPKAEAKLVRCTRGAIYDVIIDLRPGSTTYCRWVSAELTEDNRAMLYIPRGFAHGFQTLRDDSEVFYQMMESYAPEYARGIRWDDPVFGIQWPYANPIMSEKDRSYGDFKL